MKYLNILIGLTIALSLFVAGLLTQFVKDTTAVDSISTKYDKLANEYLILQEKYNDMCKNSVRILNRK